MNTSENVSKKLGIVYINSQHDDNKYVLEANASAKSFRQFLPDATYYLYTDSDLDKSKYMDQFDEVRPCVFRVPEFLKNRVHLNGQMIEKHKAMLDMNEDYVLYLGADTYALSDQVAQLPMLLSEFELAVAHAPVRVNTECGNSPIEELPICFPELNCDVILYRNTDKVRAFLKEWQSAYLRDDFGHPHDQGTFRYLLYKSDLRFYVLPPEYNYRGHEFRADTVILQNRFALGRYLGQPRSFFAKAKEKLLNG